MSKKKIRKKAKVTALAKADPNPLAPEMEDNKYAIPKTWISEKQVLKILQRTPREHIFSRPAKGGGTWEYVTGVYVEKVLNYVFGWLWDFEIIHQEVISKQVITLGRLTVKDGKGNSIVKMQNGRADIKYKTTTVDQGGMRKKIPTDDPLDLGNDYKASATDCLKKCASKFGIASDVYGREEFKEIGKPIQATAAPTEDAPITKPTLEYLFALAREYGAVEGMEAVFIQEVLDRNIDWESLDDRAVAIIKTQLTSKLTPRT